MCRSARPKKATMTLQVPVKLYGVCNTGVEDGPGGAVTTSVRIIQGVHSDMVTLYDNEEGNARLDA